MLCTRIQGLLNASTLQAPTMTSHQNIRPAGMSMSRPDHVKAKHSEGSRVLSDAMDLLNEHSADLNPSGIDAQAGQTKLESLVIF
jgi:hypothetical protein